MDALIVVDYQNDFVDGALGFAEAARLAPVIAQKMVDYHKRGQRIIQTFDVHAPNYLETREGKFLPVEHCILDANAEFDAMSSGGIGMSRLLQEAANAIEDDADYGSIVTECVTKNTFGSIDLANAFHASVFDDVEIAQRLQYEHIELCGVVSYLCVLSNAVLLRAVQPEADIRVDVQAVAGPDEKLHQEALDIMRAMGFTVYDSEEDMTVI
jgi:nicotinamidase-related amidase